MSDGTRIIQRVYTHGLITREVDTSKIDWYNKLINIKNDKNKQKNLLKSSANSERNH